MAHQLADSPPNVRSSGEKTIIIGHSLQTNQFTVTLDLRTAIIIGFSVSLIFCVVYHILYSFFYRLIVTRYYHNHRRHVMDVEEGTYRMPGNSEGWVMVGALMEEGRGETLRAMKKLPALVKYGGKEHKGTRKCEDCAICLEDFKVGDMCQVFPRCNHVFHSKCIDGWLATKLTCPTCRSYIIA